MPRDNATYAQRVILAIGAFVLLLVVGVICGDGSPRSTGSTSSVYTQQQTNNYNPAEVQRLQREVDQLKQQRAYEKCLQEQREGKRTKLFRCREPR